MLLFRNKGGIPFYEKVVVGGLSKEMLNLSDKIRASWFNLVRPLTIVNNLQHPLEFSDEGLASNLETIFYLS